MLVQQEQALYSLASTKLMNSEPNGNMKMARAGPIAANGRKKNSTNIQTPGQPDSYREMQGTIRRLLASDRCTRACLGVFILPAISWKAEAPGCCIKYQKVKP
jgi:hypothetical protein